MKGYVKDRKYYKYEKETGRLRIGGGSWTINLNDIDLRVIEEIIYITAHAKYSISLDQAMEKGFQRKFKGEDKLVVPIKNWTVTIKGKEG